MNAAGRELRRLRSYVVAAIVGVSAAAAGLPWFVAVAIAAVALLAGAAAAIWSSSRSRSELSPTTPKDRPFTRRPAGRPTPAIFRREGEYWTISYHASTFRLHDAKGLEYIHRLLSSPGLEVHVLDLVMLGRGEGAKLRDPGADGLHVGTTREPVLDARAREAYRRRVEDLRDQIEEAEANADPERAARARDELDVIAHELDRQLRGNGSPRSVPDATERARVNVSRAIRASIGKISQHDPSLGHHLDRDIRTGTYCSYLPEPGAAPTWRL